MNRLRLTPHLFLPLMPRVARALLAPETFAQRGESEKIQTARNFLCESYTGVHYMAGILTTSIP